MRRRDVFGFAGGAMAWPLVASAQPTPTMPRIGHMRAGIPPARELEAFLRALGEHGYVQGRNFVLVTQWGDGNVARLPELAVTLVNAGVDIIVTEGTIAVRALHTVTSTVPIVMMRSADPFVFGLIQNLSRPGGNVTGFSSLNVDIAGKTLEILKEMVPGLGKVATLAPRPVWELFQPAEQAAARLLGLDLFYVEMSGPGAADSAIRRAMADGARGGVLRGTPFFSSEQRRAIVESANRQRFPIIYESREYIEQGGLVSYATDVFELYRLAAGYVARILAGANPGDLPIQQPTKFELVINLKTARTLGLDVSSSLLARADAVIE